MMSKEYFFIAGFPRSGETLLSTILNQNPAFHSGPESPVCNLVSNVYDTLRTNEQQILYPKVDSFKYIARGIIDGYYSDVNKKYVFDKCRVWNSTFNINYILDAINPDIKIVCCVRSIVEILTSYICLIEKSKNSFVDVYLSRQGLEVNNLNRCEWLMQKEGLIDLVLNCMKESYKLDCIHLVEYDDLVLDTEKTISNLYRFLDLPEYQHRYKNLENKFSPRDDLLGLPDLHYVRNTVEKTSRNPCDVLPSSIIEKYKDMEFWR